MPRCEGLPNGPCPQNVNNRSVKLAQGDLLLCPKCEATRFPTTQAVAHNSANILTPPGQATARTRSAGKSTSTAGVSKFRQQDNIASKQSTPIRENNQDEEDGAGIVRSKLQEERLPLAHDSSGDGNSLMRKQIDELATTVAKQSETIDKLTSLLNMVLKYLDISDGTQTSGTLKAELNEIRNSMELRIHLPAEPRVELPSASTQMPPAAPIKGVLAAVHNEMQQQRQRRRNVVVNGLKPVDGVADADLFTALCETCLPVKPAIIRERCHRLGRQQPGKIRPLLVTLRSDEAATELLQCARLLKDSEAGAGVYINPNLTPAEAQAAFERRQRRRTRSRQTIGRPGNQSSDNMAGGREMNNAIEPHANNNNAVSFIPSSCALDVVQSVKVNDAQVFSTDEFTVTGATDGRMPAVDSLSFLG